MLRVVLDGFDKTQANATKTVSTILRHAYSELQEQEPKEWVANPEQEESWRRFS
jgi:hypothetical protein